MSEQSNAKVRQAFLDMMNAWNAVVRANRRSVFMTVILLATLVVASVAPAVSASDLPAYRIKDLGTLGGAESAANAVNNLNQVVGWSNVTPGSDIRHAFLWQNGKMKDLGTLGGDNSEARGINDNGWIVGVSQVTPGSEAIHAFLWKNGRMIDLGTMGGINSQANAINNRNEIVGWSETEINPGYYVYTHAFRWADGVMKPLLEPRCPFGDDHGSEANAINRDDQIAGTRYCYRGGITLRVLLLWDYDDSVTNLCPFGMWTQRTPAISPSARKSFKMVYDSARKVSVLFGGDDGTRLLSDTWEWNGITWSQRASSTNPPARYWHALAYDSARHVTVLFGGRGNNETILGDTWEWNGTSWVQRFPPASPPARWLHAMAFDSKRGVVVLFGGSGDCGGACSDTWEWNGTTWSQRTSSTAPPGRWGHDLAYDSARGVTVLFGGRNYGTLGDTWEWDGTTWAQRTAASYPLDREVPIMAYDSAHHVTVLFGGHNDSQGYLGDTWEWSGTTWTDTTPATSPSARDSGAMAYDSARGVTVMFGGYDGIMRLADTWEYTSEGSYDKACGTAQGVNHKEQITFTTSAPHSHGFQNAYLWDNGDHAVIDLGTQTANGINDSGMLVGQKTRYGTAYVWRNGKLQDLPSGVRSEAIGINNNDVIVGWNWFADSYAHAAMWRP